MNPKTVRLLPILLISVGALFRITGVFGSLWLDEIWSLTAAGKIHSASEIFTTLRIDNNHPLCSLMLYLIGPHESEWWYRALPYLSTLGVLYMVPAIARELRLAGESVCLLLVGTSFPITVFCTEARGYGFLLFFECVVYLAWCRWRRSGQWRDSSTVWIGLILGTLSHFSFLGFGTALLLADCIIPYESLQGRRRWSVVHSVTAGLLLLLYFAFVRGLPPGTGAQFYWEEIILNAASSAVGGPLVSAMDLFQGLTAVAVGGVVVAALLIEILLLARQRNRNALFFLLLVFLLPIAIRFVLQPRVVYERYFLTQIFWGVLLLGSFLSRMYRSTRFGSVVAILVVAAVVLGNSSHSYRLYQFGRGDVRPIVIALNAFAPKGAVVSSTQNYRTELVLQYYREELAPNLNLNFAQSIWNESAQTIVQRRADAFVIQELDPVFEPSPVLNEASGARFVLEHFSPYAGLSGAAWALYRRSE